MLDARIKKIAPRAQNGKVKTKFKLRCTRYLYTLSLDDPDKASKLQQSLPPGAPHSMTSYHNLIACSPYIRSHSDGSQEDNKKEIGASHPLFLVFFPALHAFLVLVHFVPLYLIQHLWGSLACRTPSNRCMGLYVHVVRIHDICIIQAFRTSDSPPSRMTVVAGLRKPSNRLRTVWGIPPADT